MPKCLKKKKLKLEGMHYGITGDVSGLRGDVSDIRGNVDEITAEERKNDSNIQNYIIDETAL
jgi:hypothetical protein